MVRLNSIIFKHESEPYYICHSIEMDQIGTGKDHLEAFENLSGNILKLLEESGRDKKIHLLRAPAEYVRNYFENVLKNPQRYPNLSEKISENYFLDAYVIDP